MVLIRSWSFRVGVILRKVFRLMVSDWLTNQSFESRINLKTWEVLADKRWLKSMGDSMRSKSRFLTNEYFSNSGHFARCSKNQWRKNLCSRRRTSQNWIWRPVFEVFVDGPAGSPAWTRMIFRVVYGLLSAKKSNTGFRNAFMFELWNLLLKIIERFDSKLVLYQLIHLCSIQQGPNHSFNEISTLWR